jgi:hypothetical protein
LSGSLAVRHNAPNLKSPDVRGIFDSRGFSSPKLVLEMDTTIYQYQQEVEEFLQRIREGKYNEASREIAGLRLAIVPDLVVLATIGFWGDVGDPAPFRIFVCSYEALESMGKIVLSP